MPPLGKGRIFMFITKGYMTICLFCCPEKAYTSIL
jgi:hypothetical protein